ncbi:hypothetical protein RYD26_06110 [Pasteurellaceae bacterium LIM206]|nr:hypothetical protein [Pasteurellaceae bacterium LIM206]
MLKNFNLFQRPIEKETLDSWAKWLEDIAKVAIIAVPVVFFGNYFLWVKIVNILLLLFCGYSFMLAGKLIRKYKNNLSKGD